MVVNRYYPVSVYASYTPETEFYAQKPLIMALFQQKMLITGPKNCDCMFNDIP